MTKHPLPTSWKVFYGVPKCPINAMGLVLQLSVRAALYIEALGMDPATMAICIAIAKSFDLLIAFVVAFVSDNFETAGTWMEKLGWGRRKPFMAIGIPLWILIMMLLFNPPSSLGYQASDEHIGEGVCTFAKNEGFKDNCTALMKCVAGNVSTGVLSAHDKQCTDEHTGLPAPCWDPHSPTAAFGLTVWFISFYWLFYSIGWSVCVIPYDAWGMELTDDYDERNSLFAYKAGFAFFGYLVMAIVGIGLAGAYPDSTGTQMSYNSIFYAVFLAVATLPLVKFVRDEPKKKNVEELPILPGVTEIMYNRPYLNYLIMKVPMTIATHIPVTLLPYMIKNLGKFENVALMQYLMIAVVVLTALIACPITAAASNRYGKTKVLAAVCVIDGLALAVLAFLPFTTMSMCVMGLFVGIGYAGGLILPDSLLGDIIDYDELNTGRRSEAM
jgi:Na+/melibiose symporter-like transporter